MISASLFSVFLAVGFLGQISESPIPTDQLPILTPGRTAAQNALWAENDPLAQARKVDPKAVPALYMDCGSEDRYGLASGNRDLHRILEERGIPHQFELAPGDHGYEFVRARIERSLGFLAKALRP